MAKLHLRFSEITLCLAAMLIFCLSTALCLAEEKAATAAGEKPVADAQNAPCKELKPFNNIDELLYQFYVNLDSDCMFKMPVEELEKIWNVKIWHEGHRKDGKIDPADFRDKLYNTDKDAFYIALRWNEYTKSYKFHIDITKAYDEKYATLFPDGEFPLLLPEPLRWDGDRFTSPLDIKAPEPVMPKTPGKYWELGLTKYYWLNSKKNSMIVLKGENRGVKSIEIMDFVPPLYIK